MLLQDYHPRSKLVTRQTLVESPAFPVIDSHNHLEGGFGGWVNRPAADLVAALDRAGVKVYVDLDGGWGEDILHAHLDHFKEPYPDRFIVAGGIDWDSWSAHGDRFGEWAAGRLRQQKAAGAQLLKISKVLGTQVRDQHGSLVMPNDARLEPVWQAAGELGLPVLIHVADPVAFFEPLDANNERWEELQAHPNWHFPSPPYPPFVDLVEAMAGVVSRFPETIFIGAHVAWYSENLAWVSALLERCPNLYVDIGARISELGRQPVSAREFFLQFPDRIVFGTDSGPDLDTYRIYYRFLETDDEYFAYGTSAVPGQGRWNIYGISLPPDVLEKVYNRNAKGLFGLT